MKLDRFRIGQILCVLAIAIFLFPIPTGIALLITACLIVAVTLKGKEVEIKWTG